MSKNNPHWGYWIRDNIEDIENPYIYPRGIQWSEDEETKSNRNHPCITYFVDPESIDEEKRR